MKKEYLLMVVTILKCHCWAFPFPKAECRVWRLPRVRAGGMATSSARTYFPKWHKGCLQGACQPPLTPTNAYAIEVKTAVCHADGTTWQALQIVKPPNRWAPGLPQVEILELPLFLSYLPPCYDLLSLQGDLVAELLSWNLEVGRPTQGPLL